MADEHENFTPEVIDAWQRVKRDPSIWFDGPHDTEIAESELMERWGRLMVCPYKDQIKRMVSAFVRCGKITKAFEIAKVSQVTHYAIMNSPSVMGDDYRWMIDFAERMHHTAAIDRAKQLGIDGIKKYKYGKDGKPLLHPDCYTLDSNGDVVLNKDVPYKPYFEVEFSEAMLALILRWGDPDRFATTTKTDLTSNGKSIVPEVVAEEARAKLSALSPEELRTYVMLEAKVRAAKSSANADPLALPSAPPGAA